MAYTTIDDPSAYFQTALYTGNGGTLAVTNDGNSDLQPDFVWTKGRSDSDNNSLFDSSRGTTKEINTNGTGAEGTTSGVTAFSSDGFTLGSNSGINGNTETYVAWQWKANGGTATASQSEGGTNLACSAQANTTAGFSVVTYTGSGTSGHGFLHGLGVAPNFVAVKNRSTSRDWACYHTGTSSAAHALFLNGTSAQDNSADYFPADATSTLVKVGNRNESNEDGDSFVAYCFTEIQGYSKFGSYTGNGNADGPFVYTGFKPAWIMQKNTADTTNWNIHDNKRSTFNTVDDILMANANDAEGAVGGKSIDFLSNGFKLRGNDNETNDNTDVHVYMAFAEHPFVSSKGVPTTAR